MINLSNLCNMLREMLEDEKQAPTDYEKLKSKMIGHPKTKKLISKIQDDEKRHYKELKEIANKFGCNYEKTDKTNKV